MRLLERETELRQLSNYLERSLEGIPQSVLLRGEAGIGKSALMTAFAEKARTANVCVLEGRGFDGAEYSSYWPVRAAMAALIRDTDEATLRSILGSEAPDIARAVPQLAEEFPDARQQHDLGFTSAAKFRFMESFAAFINRLGSRSGVVLAFDDVHLVDPATLELIKFLGTAVLSHGVMIVCAAREPTPSVFDDLRKEPSHSEIHVGGLSPEAVGHLIRSIAADVPSRELTAAVHSRTLGNPFYVQELAGDPRFDATSASLDRDLVPRSITSSTADRVGSLGRNSRDVFLAGSLLGAPFDADLIFRVVSGASRESVADVLEAGANKRLLNQPDRDGMYEFRSSIERDAVAASVSVSERAAMHWQICESLLASSLSVRTPDHVLRHLIESGSNARADQIIEWANKAGEAALDAYDFDSALSHFRSGLGRLSESGSLESFATLRFGEAKALHGMGQDPVVALEDAFDHHISEGELDLAMEVASYPAGPGHTGHPKLITRALDQLPVTPAIDGRILAQSALHAFEIHGDDVTAQSHFEKAQSIADETGDTTLKMWTLAWAGHVDLYAARPDGCIEKHNEALELNRQINDPFVEIYTGECVVSARLSLGDASLALDAALRMSSESERARYRRGVASGYRNEAAAHVFTGLWEEARTAISKGLTVAPNHIGLNLFGLMMDKTVGVEDESQSYLENISHSGAETSLGVMGAILVSQLNSSGEISGIDSGALRKNAKGILSASARRSVPGFAAMAYVSLAFAAIIDGDNSVAHVVTDSLEFASESYPFFEPSLITPSRLQMLLALRLGNEDVATRYFSLAARFLDKAGYKPELALTKFEYAAGASGLDWTTKKNILEESRILATELGMRPLESRIELELADSPVDSANHHDLTVRELDVAKRVATGLTNAEIATELVVSPNTVRKHVSNMLGKLNLNNRTELARYVYERELS